MELESRHPFKPFSKKKKRNIIIHQPFFYTHNCEADKIAYFKVDFNFIGYLPFAVLGGVRKSFCRRKMKFVAFSLISELSSVKGYVEYF